MNSTAKVFIIIILSIASVYLAFPWSHIGMSNLSLWWDYKLWLDLKWWVELDYKIDLDEAKKKDNYNEWNIIEWLKAIVEKRVNSLGTAEPTIMSANYWNEAHIIVQIPSSNFDWENMTEAQKTEKNNEYIQKAKDTIWKVVRLEFKEEKSQITDQDKKERSDIAQKIKSEISSNKDMDFKTIWKKYMDQVENVVYNAWSWSKDTMPEEATFTWMENVTTPFISDVLESQKRWSFTLWENNNLVQGESEKWYSIVKINSIKKEEKEREVSTWTWADAPKKKEKYTETVFDYEYIFVNQKPSQWTIAKTEDWKVLDERFLTRAWTSMNQMFQPQVDLVFNDQWKAIFAEITKRLVWKRLAIFVWGQLITAPTVNTVIPDWKAVITWDYTVDSAKKLANDIQTWIVPAPIYLTSERAIDAKIWWDSLSVIQFAWIIAFVFIMVFLIIVYRFAWILAGIALLVYITLTLALVKFTWVVLTLASIAWLILSVWLAIDANILIFERTKEEIRNNSDITKALNIWFDRSWSAIWDSHVTSFVSAIILYVIWINLIKWFWLMLWIWIIVSLFTAMWVSRVLVMVFANKFEKNLKFFIGLKK